MKTCTKCGGIKDLTEFSVDKRHSDRRASKCKACINVYQKIYRQSVRGKAIRKAHVLKEALVKPELRKARSRRAYYKNKEAFFLNSAKRRNSIQGKASREVHYAIRHGLITKPAICNKCLTPLPSRMIHAHHPDYSKPLEVEWMCAKCHGKEHNGKNYRNRSSENN